MQFDYASHEGGRGEGGGLQLLASQQALYRRTRMASALVTTHLSCSFDCSYCKFYWLLVECNLTPSTWRTCPRCKTHAFYIVLLDATQDRRPAATGQQDQTAFFCSTQTISMLFCGTVTATVTSASNQPTRQGSRSLSTTVSLQWHQVYGKCTVTELPFHDSFDSSDASSALAQLQPG